MRPGIPTPKGNSFTLLEMLGVMAVMAILAGVAVPPMLRTLQNVQTVNEDKNLEEIARALTEAIKAEGQFPDPFANATSTVSGSRGWVAMAAPYSSLPPDSIRYVYPDRPGQTERRFYILTLNGAVPQLNFPSVYTNPPAGWTTNAIGTWQNIRTSFLILISSSKPDYLLACPANDGMNAFRVWATTAGPSAVLWARNWVKQATSGQYLATNTAIVGAVQDGGGLSWTNKGQFLHVKVIPVVGLISEISFTGVSAGQGYVVRPGSTVIPFGSSSPDQVYVTQGAQVYVEHTSPNPNFTAKAVSNYLNFTYTAGGGGGGGGGSWSATP